ncbi:hypothetical protein [Methanosarcina sp. WWM596]|uniref:hypothetical protein n=1 Tax=Methanosarcina sp. WWM596 TaxID=1434103 RepID=UPI000695C419|nr:hypothetical protein [Methanosarcina sp. WWM596]
MIMLVVGMILVTPAMACPAGTPCGSKSNVEDPIQLTGEERDKILDVALKNSQVKELQKQLVADGFTQKNPETFTVPIELEDGSKTEVLVVAIPYENDTSEVKTLVYFHNPQTGESITGVIRGSLTACAIALGACLVYVGGCTVVCGALLFPDPAEPAEAAACLSCIESYTGITACLTAYCTCMDYYCDQGSQWACDHRCP